MTQQGARDLYDYLSVAWPLVIRPGIDERWKMNKMRELYQTYRDYTDAEVQRAFQKWTEENEKFPTTKNILNEIKWARVLRSTAGRENEERWPMDWIDKDGHEWSWGSFKRSDFLQHPGNPNQLQPEEWERRCKAQRRQWYKDNLPEPSPQAKAWAARITAQIREIVEGRAQA